MYPVVVMLIAVVLIAGIWTQQRNARKGTARPIKGAIPFHPEGAFQRVEPDCNNVDGRKVGPFPGTTAGQPSQLLIHIKEACGREEGFIAIQSDLRHPNDFIELKERSSVTGIERRPSVGGWYAVTVPKGGHIQLGCPGENGAGHCIYEVMDITGGLHTRAIAVTTITPACSQQSPGTIANFSAQPIHVRVTFNKRCTDGYTTQPGEIRFRQVGPHDVAIAVAPISVPPIGTPAAAPSWEGNVDRGFSLEPLCTGTTGSCEIAIQVVV